MRRLKFLLDKKLFPIKVFDCELKNYHTVNNGYVLYKKYFLCR